MYGFDKLGTIPGYNYSPQQLEILAHWGSIIQPLANYRDELQVGSLEWLQVDTALLTAVNDAITEFFTHSNKGLALE